MEYVLKFTQRSQTFKRYDIRIYQDREIYLIKFQQTLLTFLTSFKLHPFAFVSGKKFRWNSRLQHPISRMLAENVNRVFQSFFPRSLPRFTHSISIGKIGGGKCWIPRGCFRFGTWWCDRNRFPLALDQTRSEDGMLEAWISSRWRDEWKWRIK